MKIKINRFCLRYNKKMYRAGSVIDISDEATARRLVQDSKGAFAIYHEDEETVNAASADPKTAVAGTQDNQDSKDTKIELPSANPKAAVAGKSK